MAGPEHYRAEPDRCLKHLIILALISALIYIVNRWVLLPQAHTSVFFHHYLGDILALPVYLPLAYYWAKRLYIIEQDFKFRFSHILGAVTLFSVIFEGIVPWLNESSTRDILDIPAYLMGGLIVYGVNKNCPYGNKNNNIVESNK